MKLRYGVLLLGVLVAAALLAEWMLNTSGYLVLGVGHLRVEMSLWLAILALALGFVAGYGLLALLIRLILVDRPIRSLLARRRERLADRAFFRGLEALDAGAWEQAEALFSRAARQPAYQWQGKLYAAEAARRASDFAKAEHWLAELPESGTDHNVLVQLEKARLQLARGQLQSCRELAENLHRQHPNHRQLLLLLQDVYSRLPDWPALAHLLPALKAQGLVGNTEWHGYQSRVWLQTLKQVAQRNDLSPQQTVENLQKIWKSAPDEICQQPAIIEEYALLLRSLGDIPAARSVLFKAIRAQWSDELVALYGKLEAPDPKKALTAAERWLADRPENPILLLAVGRLALQNRLWGKARDCFEKSRALRETEEVLAEQVRLYQALGMTSHAEECRERYFCYQLQKLPELPLPASEEVQSS